MRRRCASKEMQRKRDAPMAKPRVATDMVSEGGAICFCEWEGGGILVVWWVLLEGLWEVMEELVWEQISA